MGSSAVKARWGWLTLLPLIDEKGKASGRDKCPALAYSRNLQSQEQQQRTQQKRFIHAYRTSVLNAGAAK